jgi:hypothetical protein
MTPRQLYLGYVRTYHPQVYYAALKNVFGRKAGLAGLGDDLTDSISPTVPDLTDVSITTPDISSDTTDAVNSAYNATLSSSSTTNGGNTDFFTSLANGIAAVAPTIVQTQAAENLLQINTQRAQMGLPPLTANGVPLTGSMLSPTSASIAQMEAALAGGAGGFLPILLIGGVAVLALAMTRKS